MNTTGDGLVRAPDARIAAILAHPGIDRSFLADETLQRADRGGRSGVDIAVRLTSYRSLPLSCIAGIAIAINGRQAEGGDLLLVIDGAEYRLAQLGALSAVWWFILDQALLFVPCEPPLAVGEHRVEGTLMTVEPYMTAGRFTFRSSSTKQLVLENS